MVHPGKDKDIGIQPGQNGQHSRDLRIRASFDIAQQQAGTIALQFGVEGRDPQGLGMSSAGQQEDREICRPDLPQAVW